MQILASKFIYPKDKENLKDTLLPFKDLSIQLAFFQRRDFLNLDHLKIKDISESLNIKIPTVHSPITDVFSDDFLDVLKLIKDVYKVKVITIHPQRGDLDSALSKLYELSPVIKDLDLILAYDNFPSKVKERKWIDSPSDMYSKFNLKFLKITFDTSHLDNPLDCIFQLDRVYDKIEIIHLSDRDTKSQHLPLGEGILPYKEFLKYLKEKSFKGFLVLEYLSDFENRLIEDLKRVSEFLL